MAPWNGTFKKKSSITIERVDHLLTQLASKYRFSDPATQNQRVWDFDTDAELKYILVRLQSWEAKWLVRLLLRNHCTIELDETFILRSYHFLLPELFTLQNDFNAAFHMLRGELSCYPPTPMPDMEKAMRAEAVKKLNAIVGTKLGRPNFHKAWSFKHLFQLTGDTAWAAEVKYDGEYCEIHVDLGKSPNDIQIFSKNGKDATQDRQPLHDTIREALRIGQPNCSFKQKCIVLGEMVLYSDRERKILPFSKIRKHISRSGSSMGTWQDSAPHEWEHLMIAFFDVLVLDDEPVMRRCLQDRRQLLRKLVQTIPGRATRSEWTLLDFKTADGITDLKQAFALSLAKRQEGLVLKPLHMPYFSLLSDLGSRQPGYFIKLKKDYLADMGGQRDLGDFAIIGASFDAQVAAKSDVKSLHWTHFHLGCLTNGKLVDRKKAKPKFKVVGSLSMDKCIPKSDLKHLNVFGRLLQIAIDNQGNTHRFDIEPSLGYGPDMTAAFGKPFVAEILGGGYEKLQNEKFEMLRHPRLTKIHIDRTWEDAITMEELERMAAEKWDVPAADKLDGHAKDVALLAKKYVKEMHGSQLTASDHDTTQQTTQRSEEVTPCRPSKRIAYDAVVQETQPESWSTTSTAECPGSTQTAGTKGSRQLRVLVREDTSERGTTVLPTPPVSSIISPTASKKRRLESVVSPPTAKRRKARSLLQDSESNKNIGAFECDSQEKTIHIYAPSGWKVQVHSS
jgi:DNA ligase-4